MIALCLTHAGLADEDRWTVDQLRKMKQDPFVKDQNISASYDYLRKDTVFCFGNIAYNARNILKIGDTPVIFLRKDAQGYDRLNLSIIDRNNNPLIVMRDNFWTVFRNNLFDLSCTARGRELRVWSDDGETSFSLRFEDISNSKFRSLLPENLFLDQFLQEMNNPDFIPTWSVTGTMRWGQVKLDITKSQVLVTVADVPGSTYGGNIISNGDTCLHVT
jgi:hypothetical protein